MMTMKPYSLSNHRKCAPCLSEGAARKLEDFFVSVRDSTRPKPDGPPVKTGTSKIPITVRQLEAIVRISESLAKMSLQSVATEHHVD